MVHVVLFCEPDIVDRVELKRGKRLMIEVTRLNGAPMLVNSDLIKLAESSPDTMLTLIHGEKLIIRESCAEVQEKILAYRATLLAAVADRMSKPGELHRIASIASISPDNSLYLAGSGVGPNAASSGGSEVVKGRNTAGLQLERTVR